MSTALSDPLSTRQKAALLAVLGLVPPVVRYVRVGLLDRGELVGNVTNVWLPLARGVLDGGQLYLAHWDNKPPLFQFLNLAVAATGHYTIVFYALIGLANAAAALLVWRLCNQRGHGFGFLAALFYIGSVGLFVGATINPRQFAALAILGAFLTPDAARRGAAIAVAGLFSQFSILAIPALVYDRVTDRDVDALGWTVRFGVAGLAVVTAVFGVVALVWGVEAATTGFEYVFLSTGEYVSGYVGRDLTAWADPLGFAEYQYAQIRQIVPLLVLAGIGVLALVRRRDVTIRSPTFLGVAVVASVGLLLPTVIRPAIIYWLPPLPFLSILAAAGVTALSVAGPSDAR